MDKVKYDFLDPNNDCGQTALKLSAEGAAIIAEIQRVSKYIPQVYLPENSYEKIRSTVLLFLTAHILIKQKIMKMKYRTMLNLLSSTKTLENPILI